MDYDARLRAIYLHACLRYVTHKATNNTSIRNRIRTVDKAAGGRLRKRE